MENDYFKILEFQRVCVLFPYKSLMWRKSLAIRADVKGCEICVAAPAPPRGRVAEVLKHIWHILKLKSPKDVEELPIKSCKIYLIMSILLWRCKGWNIVSLQRPKKIFRFLQSTLPKTKNLPLKINGWKMNFLFWGWSTMLIRGRFVQGGVFSILLRCWSSRLFRVDETSLINLAMKNLGSTLRTLNLGIPPLIRGSKKYTGWRGGFLQDGCQWDDWDGDLIPMTSVSPQFLFLFKMTTKSLSCDRFLRDQRKEQKPQQLWFDKMFQTIYYKIANLEFDHLVTWVTCCTIVNSTGRVV